MRKFFKTYYEEILKPSIKWSKKHWKGLAALAFILDIVPFGYLIYQNYKSEKKLEDEFGKDEEES